ncbi:MAG: ABC transporter ATP-binding protein/permease [Oscillospiraceae bacterium]|nr:ABC transporter ATP-binding protein/permease [Oscillospiraceae bacterium]
MEKRPAFCLFRRFIHGHRRSFFWAMVATTVSILLTFLAPQIIRFTVDGVMAEELSLFGSLRQTLIFAGLGILLCTALSGVFNYISRINLGKGTEGMIKALRDTLFAHVQKLPFKWHVDTQTGDIIQRCTSDVEVVHRFISAQLIEAIRTVVLIMVALALMFAMNVYLAIFAAIFIPGVVAYSALFYAGIAKRFLKADEAEGALMVRVQENLTGVRVVKAFGRERFELDKFHEKNNAFAKAWIDLGYLLGTYWGLGDIVTGIQTMGVVIFGAYLAVNGQLTLGELIAFISYSHILAWPIRALGRTLSEMSQTSVSAKRLLEILDAEPEEEPSAAKTPDMTQDVTFDHVTFSYQNTPVLRDLNFTIPKGSVFGILGATGSGKSTITYLLTRLYDLPEDGGKITVGGCDLREIEQDYLRGQVGLVLQEPFLFSKTIRENIAIARPDASLDRIRQVAKVADVDDNIMAFGKNYDTLVGERGVTLSGGQKQRVAIARTLLCDTPILIFDDSLSAVDMETDAKIQAALRERTKGATVILISHRVSTLMHADQILVLDEGKQTEMGDHKALLQQGGIYSRVYTLQSQAERGEVL